jgi:hypothetical protein
MGSRGFHVGPLVFHSSFRGLHYSTDYKGLEGLAWKLQSSSMGRHLNRLKGSEELHGTDG